MLLFAAALSLLAGVVLAIFGQERRARPFLLGACASCALLAGGLWVEMHVPSWALFAARLNMTSGLTLAACSWLAAHRVVGIQVRRPIIALLCAAAAINVATVWLTDLYFTGDYIDYPSGGYVAGDPRFVINPVLVCAIVTVALWTLWRAYPRAHPNDRNRIKYLLLAWGFLSLGVADYLPHFHVNPFNGAVSSFSIPLFVITFGYAGLRYRQLEFRTMVVRGSGWLFTLMVLGTVYVVFLEAADRWLGLGVAQAHIGAAAVALLALFAVGGTLPGWISRLVGGEPNFQPLVDGFSDGITALLDEGALTRRLHAVCTGPIGSARVEILGSAQVDSDLALAAAVRAAPVVEVEPLRRRGGGDSAILGWSEVLVPLYRKSRLVGALALGRRSDGTMYPRALLDALRTIANLFAMALANVRAAGELEQRHKLDRYLAPQVVQRVLAGQGGALEERQRTTITIFFSDLKDFTALADGLDPEVLAQVLNEYLSEMSDIAFRHGGTIDKFIGDAVMVLFGAPVPAPPARQVKRAVAMGLEMQRRLDQLNQRWRAARLLDQAIVCRMGIHTGEATVGSFGNRVRAEYTAIGSAVNLAARLEAACRPGRLLLSEHSYDLLASRAGLTVEPRGAVSVKGFARPVRVVEISDAGAGAPSESASAGESEPISPTT